LEIVPFWAIMAGIELIVLGSILIGVFIGRVRRRREKEGEDTPAGTVVGATLGLLAFILAFTFGMTASRFDARKQALLDEVNAIETTFLRAGLIPEPHRGEVRALLKRYVDIRVELARNPTNVQQAIEESDAIQGKLWPHAVALADADLKNPVMIGLFIQSLNEMFDLQTKRITVGLYYRIPTAIWLALLGITILTMLQVGYLTGRSRSTNWTFVIVLSLAFSAVVVLIADLDRAGSATASTIRVSQQPVIDLQRRLSE
jgi:hypothetical protein